MPFDEEPAGFASQLPEVPMPTGGFLAQTDAGPDIFLRPKAGVPVPPWSELFRAGFERENPYVSGAVSLGQDLGPRRPIDLDYDPFKDIGDEYHPYASAFIEARDEDDVNRIKARIDRERRNQQILDDGGVMGWVAGVVAGLVDPLVLVPVGGTAVTLARAGRALRRGPGYLAGGVARAQQAARAAPAFAAVSGLTTAAQEIPLQQSQITRSAEESVIAIGFATPLGRCWGGIRGGSL